MFNKFFHKQKNRKSNTFIGFFIVLCIPILILSIFMAINHFTYRSNNRSVLISNYSTSMNVNIYEARSSVNSVFDNINTLSNNMALNSIISSAEKPANGDRMMVADQLNTIISQSELISHITIINKKAGYALTSSNQYDINTYFSNIHSYEAYPPSYWQNYNMRINDVQSLETTTLKTSAGELHKVIPIVYTFSGNRPNNGLLIIDIDLNALYNILIPNTNNGTELYMLDTENNLCYDGSDFIEFPFENKELINRITTSTRTSVIEDIRMNSKEDKNKYILISSPYGKNIWGYVYLLAIPNYAIDNMNGSIASVIFLILALAVSVLLLYAWFGTKKLYYPLQRFADYIDAYTQSSASEKKSDIVDYIENSLKDIFENNKRLQNDLSNILPLSQEKYLIDILNNTSAENKEFEKIAFKNDYFLSIAFKVNFSKSFYTAYSNKFQSDLNKSIPDIISSVFTAKYICFTLQGTNNVLYLLLNLENNTCIEDIKSTIDEVTSLFEEDRDYIDIICAHGEIYQGIDGLKATHSESLTELYRLVNSSIVQTPLPSSEQNSYSINESQFTNYLIAGYTDRANKLISEAFSNFESLPKKSQQRLIEDIANVLFKVLRGKGISYNENKTNAELINDLMSTNKQEILIYFSSLTELIEKNMKCSNTKLDVNTVVDYIN